jgi:hypothetical protein
MAYWIIKPDAGADDPRWQDHRRWPEVIVQAESAAAARLAARQLEKDSKGPPRGNEWPSGRSAFDDEKLYVVRELESSDDLLKSPTDNSIISVVWPTDP